MKPTRPIALTFLTAITWVAVLPAASALAGTIRLGSVEATAVATLPNPGKYEKLAASELVAYLEKISGKRLVQVEIVDNVVPPGTIAVGTLAAKAGLITPDELAPLASDGYVARVAGGRAAICGFREVATVYGTYKCLERLGVRFYAKDCEVVPKQENLVVADCDLHDKPFFECRVFYMLEKFFDRRPSLKLGNTLEEEMGDPSDIGEPGYWDHSSAFLVPYKTYGKTHPEYYALMKDGTRLHPIPGKRFDIHLCLTNPDVRRISIERMLMLIGKQQERAYFVVSPGDGYDWCQCERCKTLDAVPGVNVTDRYLDFVNEVARVVGKKYPDKKIAAIAYTQATSTPPTRVKPEPNVFIVYCTYPPHTKCHQHDLTCELNKEGRADIEGLAEALPRTGRHLRLSKDVRVVLRAVQPFLRNEAEDGLLRQPRHPLDRLLCGAAELPGSVPPRPEPASVGPEDRRGADDRRVHGRLLRPGRKADARVLQRRVSGDRPAPGASEL